VRSNKISLKNQRITTRDCRYIGIRKLSLFQRLYSFCLKYSCSRFQGSGAVHVKDLKSFHEEARRSSEEKFRNSWGKPLSLELLLQLGQVKFRNNWGKQLSQDLFIQLGQVKFRNSWCKLLSQDLFKQN